MLLSKARIFVIKHTLIILIEYLCQQDILYHKTCRFTSNVGLIQQGCQLSGWRDGQQRRRDMGWQGGRATQLGENINPAVQHTSSPCQQIAEYKSISITVDWAFNFHSASDRVGFADSTALRVGALPQSRLCVAAGPPQTHAISRSRIPRVLATHPIVESLETGQTQRTTGRKKGFCASRNELDDGAIPIGTRCVVIRVCMSGRFLCDHPLTRYSEQDVTCV